MALLRRILLAGAALWAGVAAAWPAQAQSLDDLAPYKMIRSLQFVQDTVVLGDHSAMEMQRFLLATIDERLRAAEASIFDDPRNVDAALVYAMSGGNPETLEMLIARDVAGHFDPRVTDALRSYLSGTGVQSAKPLAEIFPEYMQSRIGPYLALVSANSVLRRDPALALRYFDQARLSAPGTIVEEAALRRSIYIASQSGWVDRSMDYANRYARRFLRSPYASQFADLFVKLSVDHFETIDESEIPAVLSFMDVPRQREVYLRMARLAAISGKNRLASLASKRAEALAGDGESVPRVLAELYGGLAAVPSAGVAEAMETLIAVPDDQLSAKDRALKAAATAIAEEVLRVPAAPAPSPEIPPQDGRLATTAELDDRAMDPRAPALVQDAKAGVEPKNPSEPADGDQAAADPAFDTFVSDSRSRLDEIDALLRGEGS